MNDLARTLAVAEREFRTLLGSRQFLALAVGFLLAVVGFVLAGAGDRGFVLLGLSLLTPLEVLLPVLAVAVGYRAILEDARRGELDTLRTYPLSRYAYVGGVYLGRLAALLPTVLLALAVAGALTAVGAGPATGVVASHTTVDSPLLYVRFVLLTEVYAAALLAVAVALSSVVRSTVGALAAAATALLVLVVGFDLGLVGLLAGGDGPVPGALVAASPNGAYRGLVLELVVHVVTPERLGAAATPVLSLGSLGLWTVLPLALAAAAVWRD